MSEIVFITRPDHDDVTRYLSEYGKEYIDFANERGFNVIDFTEDKCSREQVEKLISRQSPRFIVFNGHGSEDAICGKLWDGFSKVRHLNVEDSGNFEVIVDLDNKELLGSKIIYSIACCSAAKLGLEVARLSENTSYVGYEEEFMFLMDKNNMCRPRKDPIARAFLEPSNRLVLSILKGDAVNIAYQKSQNCIQKWINYFESERVPLHESMSVLPILYFNKECQKIHGNPNLCLK